jgi:hypothetical protein
MPAEDIPSPRLRKVSTKSISSLTPQPNLRKTTLGGNQVLDSTIGTGSKNSMSDVNGDERESVRVCVRSVFTFNIRYRRGKRQGGVRVDIRC